MEDQETNGDSAATVVDISDQFDGKIHNKWFARESHYRPNLQDIELVSTTSDLYRHQDILGRVTYKPKDVTRQPLAGE